MELLLSTRELREVVVPAPVAAIPGRPKGIQGVVVHRGEFLSVLAWEDLPGCQAPAKDPVALAVLRPRLAVPLERMLGTIDLPAEAWREVDESDPAQAWLGGIAGAGERELLLLDPDRLVALLRRFRSER